MLIRAALVRLLWRAVADQDNCDDRAECAADPGDLCEAMRALGYADHFDAETFQKRALAEPRACERCTRVTHRVRCQGCYRDLCEPCLALPDCAHSDTGIHRERA